MQEIITYDFEITKDWWCCGFMNSKYEYSHFESGQELDLIDYIIRHKKDTIMVGYNSFHFDRWCLKCIWYGVNPWKVVDYTILKGMQPHMIPDLQYKKNVDFATFDLMRVLGPSAPALKDIEANMGLEVVMNPIKKDEGLTRYEKDLMIKYNEHDCFATYKLYERLKGELDTYLTLIDKFNLPMNDTLNKKKSQLFETIFKGKFKRKLTPYSYRYKAPKFLKLNDEVKTKMESFDFTADNIFGYELMWEGYPYVFGRGGAHYAIKNYSQELDDNHILVLNDFSSFYPSMMCNKTNEELRYVDDILNWKEFRSIVDMRLDAKASGNSLLADSLKVPINAAYGKLIDPTFDYSYWPAGLNVCLTGQLITLMICKELKRQNIGKLIQVNTDGFYYLVDKDELQTFENIMNTFQSMIGIDFERDIIKNGKIVQKDVNNYVIYDADTKHFKVKGGMVRKFQTKKDYMYYSNSIIDDAIVNNLIFNTPINTTIFNAFNNNESKKFQIVYNTKGKNFQGTYYCIYKDDVLSNAKEIQKINRGWAVCNAKYGSIRKLKNGTYNKFPNTPEHVYVYNGELDKFDITKIGLDINWYVKLAKEGVRAFLGE